MKVNLKLALMPSLTAVLLIGQTYGVVPAVPTPPLSKEEKKEEKKKEKEAQKIAKETADLQKKVSNLHKEIASFQTKITNAQERIESFKKERLNWQEADKLILRAEQLLQGSYFFNYEDALGGPSVGGTFKTFRGKAGISDALKGGSLGYYYHQFLTQSNPRYIEKRIEEYRNKITEYEAKIAEYEAKITKNKNF